MRSKLLLGSALVAMTLLAACSRGDRPGVMAGRSSNLDAFAVSKRAPLTIPPDFALVPPKPGASRPQEADSSQQALSALFGNEKVFPIALSQLMAVGERTGNMDEMLSSIAKYYEEEFTAVVDGLSTIIEPLMIVFVGLMIGLMVVALYLPIFSAGDAIR